MTDEELEKWVTQRLSPKHFFNMQFARDLRDEILRRIDDKALREGWKVVRNASS